ncbi:hypothetical protein JOC37_000690 [Desulfohalotomaculum tongense]|uniref:helicase-related protein n=1 Tax=Desulforadius tongensis TaxID=1216062 RepID=UPI00195D4C48|nr:helicase-related protein [Desulforadius tongensis]MBM7854317.1 hypothetical protein [Desulforadius tongensis]
MSLSKADEYAVKEKLCEYLIKRITECTSGSGKGEDGEYCLYERPRDTYFVGSLRPNSAVSEVELSENELRSEFHSRLSPYALGFECRLKISNRDAMLKIRPNMSLYYRIVPDLEQQKRIKGARELAVVFKRLRPNFPFITVNLSLLIREGKKIISSSDEPFKRVMEDIYEEIKRDSKAFKKIPERKLSKNPDESPDKYEEFFNELIRDATHGDVNLPKWKFELHIELNPVENDVYLLKVLLVNTGEDRDPVGTEKMEDSFIFDASIETSFVSAELIPFEFNSLKDSYRYDTIMPAIGLNCTVEPLYGDDHGRGLKTVNAPVVRQKRYGTRTQLPKKIGGRKLTELTFRSLSDDPINVLEELLKDMEDYYGYWEANKNEFLKDARYEEEFKRDLDNFRAEIDRYKKGIEVLKNHKYEMLNKAFRVMNEAFIKKNEIAGRGYEGWRPFQLVFIVSQLPDLAAQHWTDDFKDSNSIESPVVLWFPTGGGKTEAYLGLTICNAFFDRLRGKTAGLTALFRFPLRLLSAQQLERLTGIIGAAELIREERAIKGEPFSVGLWVGSSQTQNNIYYRSNAEQINDDPDRDKKYRKVHVCPFCGRESVKIRFDFDEWRLVHECTSDSTVCSWGGRALPIYIVDDEIYRYLPTVIVSTVDKIALCGYQTKFGNLFGDVRYKCDKHGYLWEDKCRYCGGRKVARVDDSVKRLMVPTLQVQDEIHLVKEELGAFDSHYETFIVKMQKDISGGRAWKNIASTATIKRYEYHVDQLYCRDEPYRFPVPGPSWEESFYSDTDTGRIGRYFLGIMPHNKTHINSTVEILWYFHREIQRLRKLSAAEFADAIGVTESLYDKQVEEILDEYEVSLTYVLTKRGGDQVAESIASQINLYLTRDGYTAVRNEMMTGGTEGYRITALLKEMQEDYKNKKPEDRIRSVTATSMISHGVDIERFNFMVFFGMPRQTAEYIQASSRVGRKSPGISIICFAPARERDRSHYHYFSKYHEYTERLVEPPAINRWSKFSIDKTLPGIFSALILNRYSRLHNKSLFKKKAWYPVISSLDMDEVKEYLHDAYRTDLPPGSEFKSEIDKKLTDIVYILANERTKESLPLALGYPPLIHKPMRSLRDTDEPIYFTESYRVRSLLKQLLRK